VRGRNRIRKLRQAAGLSLRELAGEVGIDESTLSRWERGETKRLPDDDKLTRLGARLGVTVPYLMGWVDGENGNGDDEEAAA
jgi:transcriptional regulator with XRE-family HTH domain